MPINNNELRELCEAVSSKQERDKTDKHTSVTSVTASCQVSDTVMSVATLPVCHCHVSFISELRDSET